MSAKSIHKIIIGDSRWMEELSDSSVQLVVASPPYWQLKDYGSPDQIGYNKEGLTLVDTDMTFKFKEKFLELQQNLSAPHSELIMTHKL